ncbi:MAG: hypothetical protein JWM44_1172 [Bacilli bacterium]|nr:hypothetical protein [Bacilli bacterium]
MILIHNGGIGLQRDYIMRMLTQFTAAVAQLMGLKQEKKHDQIFIVVNDTLEKYYRLNSKLLQSMSDRDLLSMLKTNEMLDTEKAIMIAYLLKTEGESYEALEQLEESYKRYLTSLTLFLAAAENDPNVSIINIDDEIDDLLTKLGTYELPIENNIQIFHYLLHIGHYASAEDVLFELTSLQKMNEYHSTNKIALLGVQFYEQLLLKADYELIAGGLPRDEVTQGLAQFKQILRIE